LLAHRGPNLNVASSDGSAISPSVERSRQRPPVSYYNSRVEIHSAARKHGIADDDIQHAVAHAQGDTASGVPITDKLIEKLAAKAEAGYDVEETLRRHGPAMGSAAASVESVRLEPELREALAQRAEHDHETTSSVIRKALREYLKVA
jgi:hypothetical protein